MSKFNDENPNKEAMDKITNLIKSSCPDKNPMEIDTMLQECHNAFPKFLEITSRDGSSTIVNGDESNRPDVLKNQGK